MPTAPIKGQSKIDVQYLPEPAPGPSKREWFVFWLLLGLVFFTTSIAGLLYAIEDTSVDLRFLPSLVLKNPQILLWGLPFSLPLVSILLAHEFGHYLACRYYGMRCTPPYFLPFPIPLTGTLGAFIRIKSPFKGLRALFDIGIAGPLAGFIITIPVLAIGISVSIIVPKSAPFPESISFGEPLLFRLLAAAILGYDPDRQDLLAHPMAIAGWIGLLATSLNLLPIWQLDGGHLAYAVLGRARQKALTLCFLVGLVLLSFWGWPTPSYLLFAVLLIIIGLRVRFYHPSTLNDAEPLGAIRITLSVVALAILVLSFTPVPISLH